MALSISGNGTISTDNTDPISLSANGVQGAKVDSTGAFTQSPSEISSLGITGAYSGDMGGISRFKDVTYTNTTGRPLFVVIRATGNGANHSGRLTVDGVPIGSTSSAYTSTATIAGFWVVPSGSTYVFQNQGGTANLASWFEL